ncbi:hypothetical protein pb186bvf_005142 [Paramecium bursaria]
MTKQYSKCIQLIVTSQKYKILYIQIIVQIYLFQFIIKTKFSKNIIRILVCKVISQHIIFQGKSPLLIGIIKILQEQRQFYKKQIIRIIVKQIQEKRKQIIFLTPILQSQSLKIKRGNSLQTQLPVFDDNWITWTLK